MPTPMRRPVTGSMLSKRRVVNGQSLGLLVRSGVIRRADSMPPLPIRHVRVQLSAEQQRAVCNEVVREHGWLSRVVFGPQPHPALIKRSSFDGRQ